MRRLAWVFAAVILVVEAGARPGTAPRHPWLRFTAAEGWPDEALIGRRLHRCGRQRVRRRDAAGPPVHVHAEVT